MKKKMTRIGQQQLKMLITFASMRILITPDKVSASLVKRGLMKKLKYGCCMITPAGLRVLADEMEAGRVEEVLDGLSVTFAPVQGKQAKLKHAPRRS